MSNKTNAIDEVIRMQAVAVKNQSNNEKAAELLKQAAELLKGDSGPRVNILEELTTAKAENVAKYGAAFNRLREEEERKQKEGIHAALTNMGWRASLGNLTQKGYATYINDKWPDDSIGILGKNFKVTSNGEIKTKGELKNLLHSIGYYR